MRRPEIILKIKKKEMASKPIIYRGLIDFINHRKKTNRVAVLSSRPLPIFLNTETTDQIFQQSGIEIPSGKY